MKSGQKQLAIENYKKPLEKDPTNDNAKQLEEATPKFPLSCGRTRGQQLKTNMDL
jgi:hypothetical protein